MNGVKARSTLALTFFMAQERGHSSTIVYSNLEAVAVPVVVVAYVRRRAWELCFL